MVSWQLRCCYMQITNPCLPLVVASHCLCFCICRFRRVELSAFVFLQTVGSGTEMAAQTPVFVYLCICVFVYLCICVFVYLCICAFMYLYCVFAFVYLQIVGSGTDPTPHADSLVCSLSFSRQTSSRFSFSTLYPVLKFIIN